MPWLTSMLEPLRRILTHPVEELNRWQRSLRYFLELMGHCWRQLNEDRAEEMAAALTYRTIFSLIPLLVLGLVMFRIFGGFEVVQDRILPAAYTFFGVPEVEQSRYAAVANETAPPDAEGTVQIDIKSTEQEVAEAQAAPPPGEAPRTPEEARAAQAQQQDKVQVRGAIQKAINDLIADLSDLNFASIGAVGIIVFIYAAMTLALAVEYDFNIIFKSPTGRPWHLRVPIYWSAITLGSGLLGLSLYLSGQIVEEARELHVWDWVLAPLSRVLAFVASWTLLFLLYVLIPNTRVRLRPAFVGSFVAALLWEAGKVGFQAYVSYTLPYSQLYGTLGLIPLFLLWVYISWLIVLFGLELTYAEQMMRGSAWRLRHYQEGSQTLLDPRWLIPVMATVGDAFRRGETMTVERLAERLALPARAVSELMEQLQRANLVHRVDDGHDEEDPGYTLARPPEDIGVSRLLEVGRAFAMQESSLRRAPAQELLAAIDEAERRAVDHETLATVLARNGSGAAARANGSASR